MTFLANEIRHTLLLGWGQWGQLQLSFHVWEEEQRLFLLCRHGGRPRDVRAGESFPVSLLFFDCHYFHHHCPHYYYPLFDVKLWWSQREFCSQSLLLRLLSHVLTILSYSAFIIALPITYWICIKRVGMIKIFLPCTNLGVQVGTSQKMIVFRLGKMIGAKGPGTVLVFPWLDRYQVWLLKLRY